MTVINIKTTKQITPKCYAYTTPQIKEHDGWVKIGYTEQDDVNVRIRQQTQSADIDYNLEWVDTAVYIGTNETFKDKDFHTYLYKKGIKRLARSEWFYITPQKALEEFKIFKKSKGIIETPEAIPYKLRQEQERAIEKTKDYFALHEYEEPEFLWNAKPRFGKTLSTYDLCKKIGARKILIVTNRPAIANSWYDDYVRFLGRESDYCFISEVDALKHCLYVLNRKQYLENVNKYNGFIEFISLPDLKGSIHFGGLIDKLKHIADLEWDLLVIDEAHEGIDTHKTDNAFNHIKRKYTLHLSGTPFKALANNKFKEDAIYNWTYADEQRAKNDWDNSLEEENPYKELPKLNLYTYQMSEIIRDKLEKGADFDDDGENESYAFDLNEFFDVKSDKTFVHDVDVDKFLDALVTQSKFPFSTPELREELKHTFWLLNEVKSAKALAKKLENHPIFGKYEIVVAAGDGKKDENDIIENEKSFNRVNEAIKKNEKTITISVGQLTTGVTIPEWTAVLMLSNVKSPSLYMQAAFRAQNPCIFNINNQLFRKENAYVFDFDPARTLEIVEKFANDLSSNTHNTKGDLEIRKRNIMELVNFFPLYGEDDEGEMIALDAEKVLSVPRKIHAREVVRRGFMSNFLFQNISNIFNAPKEVIDIIEQFEPVKEPAKEVKITPKTKDELSLNENNEVVINEQAIKDGVNNIFGDKMYKEVNDKLVENVEMSRGEINNNSKKDEFFEKLKKQLSDVTNQSMVNVAKEHYGKEMSTSVQNTIKQKISAEADKIVAENYGDFKIKKNIIENDRKKEIKQAMIENKFEDIDKINKKFDKEQEENKIMLIENIKEKVPDMTENAAAIIVETVEKNKKNKDKNFFEKTIKDHLRGFSRTIPSFLMAYGDENTTLENFDTIIPDEVFKEVTSINLKDFRLLRDGGECTNGDSENKYYEGHFFDPIVFNDSIKEFLRLKKKLANYFDENSKEDIFDYIPPQKTNQIYTPKKVVLEMVDNLEKENPECFEDINETFIDLYMKSGLYITEIVKRLFKSKVLKEHFPNEKDRLKHIFEKQVYGLAPTEIIYRIAANYILGFDEDGIIKKHNLRKFDTLPSVQKGTLEKDLDNIFC